MLQAVEDCRAEITAPYGFGSIELGNSLVIEFINARSTE